jgi:predicted TIM-barrel fold metal-dependent hydrolase
MNAITQGAIDCDIHPGVPSMKALLPYMDDHWRDAFVLRGMDNFDLASYPPGAPISCRPDWRPKQGKPGTDFSQLQSQALDAFGARYAICNTLYGGQAVVSETMGAAMCSAINDWIEAEWLARDARLRASIVVPAQSPELSVKEIERKAADRRYVQILMPVAAEMLYGKRYYWPIYEIAEHYDLPVGLHAGSMYRHAPTANGWPSHYLHDYVSQSQVFEDQLLSLVSEGVFTKFSKLRVVLIESGVTWLPHFLWRAIKTWHGVRAEVPWVKRSPAEYIRDHVRMTAQPIDVPPDADGLAKVIEEIGDDRMLLFATDYPHWQFDGDAVLPPGLPPALVRRIMVDNPLETYPRLKESVA